MLKKILFLTILLFFFAFLGWVFYDIPSPKNLSSNNLPVSTKIFDRNGKLIYEIYANQRRTPVNINQLPSYVKNATIAIEDREFYKHHGFSLTGIARAFYKTVFKHKLEGGSTLTQQLVKNSLLTPERTIKRKIKEFVLATLVELTYSKDKILEMYLNQIPYGSTAYGIESASELYFGKEAKDLTLAEAALLAGLPAAPTAYSPFGAHPERAKARQELVLKRMVEDGYITQDEADKAKTEELKYAKPEKLRAAHFTLWAKELLAEKYGDSVVEQGGLRVTTTLDLDLQEFAEEQVASEVAKLKKQNVGNGIALVTRPKSGEILAMVGSKDYFAEDEDGKVNVILSLRQPGSSIKPLNYALAIENKIITASTPLADIPTCFIIQGQAPYCPKNYDNTFHGIQQVRYALGNSLNIPAVRVLALNGIENFIDFAKKMGITTFDDPSRYGLSLTLGGGEVKPYDMAVAFGVFANQGVKVPLNPILKVEDWKGKVYEETKPDEVEGERVLSSETAFIISNILSDNGARSMAFGPSSLLNVKGHPEAAVKTGTTNDRRDNWTIGYTSQILVLSWVGNNNNEEMSGAVSGVSGASPIWNQIITYALDKAEKGEYNKNDQGHGTFPKPDGIIGTNICSDSGNKATDDNGNPLNCPTRFEYFLKDKIGAGIDMGQKDIAIDKTTGALANPKTPPENVEMQNKLVLIDPLGTAYCFDCIATQSATISYPLPTINKLLNQ